MSESKAKKKKGYHDSRKDRKNPDVRMLWPLCLLSIIPLIVYPAEYDTGMKGIYWFGDPIQTDLFLYCKMWFLIALGAIMLVKTVIYVLKGGKLSLHRKIDKIQWFPLFGYLILAFLSSCASDYPHLAFNGGFEAFESIFAVLTYGMVAFYAYQFIDTKRDVLFVLNGFAISSFVVAVLGILQKRGINYLSSKGFKYFIEFFTGRAFVLSFVDEQSTYSTLYNTNYTGMFCAFMILLVFTLFLYNKKVVWRIFYALDVAALAIHLVSTNALTSVVILGVTMTLALLFRLRFLLRNWKYFLPTVLVLVCIIYFFPAEKKQFYLDKLKRDFENQGKISEVERDIITGKEGVRYRIEDNWLNISIDTKANSLEQMLVIRDEAGNSIEKMELEQGQFQIADEKYANISVKVGYLKEETPGFILIDMGREFGFLLEDGYYYFYDGRASLAVVDTSAVEVNEFFDERGTFASSRGYYWARTIPLVKHYILLGAGRDNFMMAYPNYDMFRNGYTYQILTRPHNLYLQLMIQDGVVGTLLLFISCFIYAIRFLRSGRAKRDTLQYGVFFCMIGYALLGITNDSLVFVTSIFWLVVGIGIKGVSATEAEESMEDSMVAVVE